MVDGIPSFYRRVGFPASRIYLLSSHKVLALMIRGLLLYFSSLRSFSLRAVRNSYQRLFSGRHVINFRQNWNLKLKYVLHGSLPAL